MSASSETLSSFAPVVQASPMVRSVTVLELHDQLLDGGEIALLDGREPGIAQREETLLLAVSFPSSLVELRAASLVPRLRTRVVVLDNRNEGIAEHVAVRLGELGYTDVATLDGGVEGWRAAGFETFAGIQSLGQAFGEFVEDQFATPHIGADDVKRRIDGGEHIVLLDSRPLPEFSARSIPGAIASPGAELVYCVNELALSPETPIVVNCAGRTRSILGAQALINAGVPNPVYALENGTMSWSLNDFPFAFGETAHAPQPSAAALATAIDASSSIAARFGVQYIDRAALDGFAAEGATRSLFLLDVRGPDEYVTGHLPGSRSTPSWEIVPWVFRHLATRNGRLVLVDGDDGVRATVTASWLDQIGWGEVFVLQHAFDGQVLETGAEQSTVLGDVPQIETITVQELASTEGLTVLDVGSSTVYEDGHIPGAWFGVRSRLQHTIGGLPGASTIVVTAGSAALAQYAAADLSRLTDRRVVVLEGGTAAWTAAGLPVEQGLSTLLDETIDVAETAWRSRGDRHEAFRNYLTWEVALREQIARDDTVPFRSFAMRQPDSTPR